MLLTMVDRDTLIRDPEGYHRALAVIKDQLGMISGFYPEFDGWFSSKVLPGLKKGERSILLEHTAGRLSGIAIVKSNASERKLCCLRVLPPYQGSGVGLRLFERAFDVLETRAPLLSVAEEQVANFDRIFKHYGFELAKEYRGLYRPKKTEFSFNGLLDSTERNSSELIALLP
ncbi:GNAT family N-acetyltransferase [Ralstonia pseudosolanacearum]|uniref:GNAT family N-acetyltransferase n=1 Tax=Ralstonia pseudosolanacearum TaxID=1310165 RepID=UPI003391F24E